MRRGSSCRPNTHSCACACVKVRSRMPVICLGSREKDRNRVCCCGRVHWVITTVLEYSGTVAIKAAQTANYRCRLARGAYKYGTSTVRQGRSR